MQQDEVGPVFPRTLRGYAPAAVEQHVAQLRSGLRAEGERATAAERDRDAALERARAAEQAREAQQRDVAQREAQQRDAQQRETQQRQELEAQQRQRLGAAPVSAPPPPQPRPGPAGPVAAGPAAAGSAAAGARGPGALRSRTGRTAALAAAGALLLGLGLGAGGALLLDDDAAATPAAAAPEQPSDLGASPPTVSGDPVVPEGWTSYTSPDGSSLAVPPDWKQEGIADGTRWVSASGATEVRVITAPADDPAELEAEIASRAGYERLGGGDTSVRGEPAYVFDYLVRDGTTSVQGSDQAVVVDGTGYLLHVQSREEVWPSVAPLLEAIRGAFVPGG